MIETNPAIDAYKTMLHDLVNDGKTDFGIMEAVDANIVAWAKFKSEPEYAAERIDSAMTWIDGWCGAAIREDWADFGRILKEGMGHALADAIQQDIDNEIKSRRFSEMIEAQTNAGSKWRF